MRASATLLFALYMPLAHAVDGVAITGGSGPDADMAAVSVQWDWNKRWFTAGAWSLGGYWELQGSYWKGDGRAPEKDIFGVGFTPVFRFERVPLGSVAPYVEGGIGVHQFSGTQLTGSKTMGTRFEFGDHVGFGVRFGEGLRYDLGYRFQHFSNASITSDNPGVNFNEIRLRYSF